MHKELIIKEQLPDLRKLFFHLKEKDYGTYVSEDGDYTIIIDDEGRLTLNGAQCSVSKIEGSKYSLFFDGISYQLTIGNGHATLICATLGITVELERISTPDPDSDSE